MESRHLLNPPSRQQRNRPGALLPLALAALLFVAATAAGYWRYARAPATGALPVPVAVLSGLRPGDLVFRVGTEPVSDSVRLIDGGGYSHVGILAGGPGHWQVVHAVPAERAGRSDGVVVDDLAFFLDRARSRRAGFFRVRAAQSIRRQAVVWATSRRGMPFRIEPAGANTPAATMAGATYCTTLINDAYRHGGLDLRVRFQHLDLPLLQGDYLLPSALLASPRLQVVYETRQAGG